MSPSPDVPARREGGDLADYASLLRRRWLIICSLLLTGAGGGAALLRLTPPSYTASAQVLVTATGSQEQTNQVTNRQREPLNLDTEAQIARSAVVSAKAREMPGELGCPAEVSVPPNTSVLEISCTATDPRAAASGASAYALAYLAQRRESSTQMLTAQLKAVMVKLRQVNAGLAKVATTLPGLSSGTTERAPRPPAEGCPRPPGPQPHRQVRRPQDRRRHSRVGDQPGGGPHHPQRSPPAPLPGQRPHGRTALRGRARLAP